jgi:2-polyprenyl-6-methoxyphenol hydroxylase-like FAD-dependent oxidoreductase
MHVLISGAGIAGPTLAWFLAKVGVHIYIVEKSDSLLSHGQSVDFKGSATTVIKRMGLMDQIKSFSTIEKGAQFIDPKGRPFASFPVQKGHSASITSEVEILRGDLAAVLYEATKDHPNITYLFGTTIKEVISNNNDNVKVELSNGEVQEFADAGWQAQRLLDAMDQAPDFYFHAIQQIKMSKWSNYRVVCLGDAAHAPSPLTGMGTSLAITGAYVLAGELSKLGDGEPPSKALEAYESTFRPLVEESQKIPFLFQPLRIPRQYGRDGCSKPLCGYSPSL